MKEILLLNPEDASDEEVETYAVRKAARAVLFDEEENVALLYVSHKNYYKLPGGGLDTNEDVLIALKRECTEEIGCDIEVEGEVGMVVEYRKMFNLKQISYCYCARVKGEKGIPAFTQEELQDGFEVAWLPYDEAIRAVAESNSSDKEGKIYIIPRDTVILQAAKNYVA